MDVTLLFRNVESLNSRLIFLYQKTILISNLRFKCLQTTMLLSFKIIEHARNHSKKFPKIDQTSFSGIVNYGYSPDMVVLPDPFTDSKTFDFNVTLYSKEMLHQ